MNDDEFDRLVDDATHAVGNLIPGHYLDWFSAQGRVNLLTRINDALTPILRDVTKPSYMDRVTLERKILQAYDLAGCARQDRDKPDEIRWTNEASAPRKAESPAPGLTRETGSVVPANAGGDRRDMSFRAQPLPVTTFSADCRDVNGGAHLIKE